MRCHFRRQHASFWASIPDQDAMSGLDFNRRASCNDGSDDETIPPSYDINGSLPAFDDDFVLSALVQESLLPDGQPDSQPRPQQQQRGAHSHDISCS
jgi:hypothetical protein